MSKHNQSFFHFDEYAPFGLLIIDSKEKINISCSSHLGLFVLKKFIQGKVSCRHLLLLLCLSLCRSTINKVDDWGPMMLGTYIPNKYCILIKNFRFIIFIKYLYKIKKGYGTMEKNRIIHQVCFHQCHQIVLLRSLFWHKNTKNSKVLIFVNTHKSLTY